MSVPHAIDVATNDVGTNISDANKNLKALKDQGFASQYLDYALEHLDLAGKANQRVYDTCKEAFTPKSDIASGEDVGTVPATPVVPQNEPLPEFSGDMLRRLRLNENIFVNGQYQIPGVSDEVARQLVNAYASGGSRNDPMLTRLAGMSDDQIANLQASYPTGAHAWLRANGDAEAFIGKHPNDWPAMLALAGR